MALILASSSKFRKTILEKIGISFSQINPEIDETALQGEKPSQLVERLALAKAKKVSANAKDFVIGSDQVATIDGDILGKPHTVEKAVEQLMRFSGREVTFLTGLCLRYGNQAKTHVEEFKVCFRKLSEAEIREYIKREMPLESAGSFKSEGLGILLFSKLEGRDPNALIGLPLIALNELFLAYGLNLLTDGEKIASPVG